jgi:hypothetical protein
VWPGRGWNGFVRGSSRRQTSSESVRVRVLIRQLSIFNDVDGHFVEMSLRRDCTVYQAIQ